MKLYLSYRRSDTATFAGRLSDRLAAHFGPQSVFKALDSIPAGATFLATPDTEVQQCDVLLALIGRNWLTEADATGRRRLDNPNDFVRHEVETALRRSIPVVPVLLEGAQMPRQEDLPATLTELAYRNAAELRGDPDFHRDSDRLIRALEKLAGSARRSSD